MTDAEHPLRAMLEAGLSALALDTALAGPLLAYLDLLQRWNATYNLTAIRDPRAMVTLHLLDSLAMHGHLDGVRTLAGVVLQIDKSLEECARVCGAGWVYQMRTVTLPLLKPGIGRCLSPRTA